MTLVVPASARSDNVRGIMRMLAAMAVFVFNDTLVKLAAAHIPTGEAIFLRGVFSTSLCFILIFASGLSWALPHALSPRILLRGSLDIGSSVLFLVALVHMPIGDVYRHHPVHAARHHRRRRPVPGREGRLAAMARHAGRPDRRADHRPAGRPALQSLRFAGARLARCSRRRATSSRAASRQHVPSLVIAALIGRRHAVEPGFLLFETLAMAVATGSCHAGRRQRGLAAGRPILAHRGHAHGRHRGGRPLPLLDHPVGHRGGLRWCGARCPICYLDRHRHRPAGRALHLPARAPPGEGRAKP